MNRVQIEVDVINKAQTATHKIEQPSWLAHCLAFEANLIEVLETDMQHHSRVTVKTPAYAFGPVGIKTPYYG